MTKEEVWELTQLLFVIIVGTALVTSLIFYAVVLNYATWGGWILSLGIAAGTSFVVLGMVGVDALIRSLLFRVRIEESQRMSKFVDEVVKIYGGVKEDESAN